MSKILEEQFMRLGEDISLSPIPTLKKENEGISIVDPSVISESVISEFISKSFFNKAGFIAHEKWDTNINIQSKVTDFNGEYVECLCLMDKENHYFEYRSFPRILFDNIDNLKNKPYLILNIKSKASSIRIDVSEGDKRVEKKLFELEEDWGKLDDSGLETPYTGIDI